MVERTLKGKISKYTEIQVGLKNDGVTPWIKTSAKVGEDYIPFFGSSKQEVIDHQAENPVGSEVSVILWQNEGDKYWSVKKDSYKLISLPSATATPTPTEDKKVAPKQENTAPQTSDNYWRSKDARDEENMPKHFMARSIESACRLYNLDITKMTKEELLEIDNKVQIIINTAKEFFNETCSAKMPEEYPKVEIVRKGD